MILREISRYRICEWAWIPFNIVFMTPRVLRGRAAPVTPSLDRVQIDLTQKARYAAKPLHLLKTTPKSFSMMTYRPAMRVSDVNPVCVCRRYYTTRVYTR